MRTLDERGNPIQVEEKDKGIVTKNSEDSMTYTNKTIDKSRRTCTLSENMIKMLVKQMSAELANHNLYRTFANYFAIEGLPKLEEYFLARAKEEYLHHDWIYKYLSENDAVYQYPPVPPINVDITNRIMPFDATVDREIETTMSINLIVDEAMKEKDWATFQWLHGTDTEEGMLVKEQVKTLPEALRA